MPSNSGAHRWLLVVFSFVLLLAAFLAWQRGGSKAGSHARTQGDKAGATKVQSRPSPFRFSRLGPRADASVPVADAAEVVRGKVARFSRLRLALARELAESNHLVLPPDVEKFFAAVETGDWAQVTNLFTSLQSQVRAEGGEDLRKVWGAVHETYGVADVAHTWPADRLLQYGQTVLGALKPGMVYVGGTDAGRFIPTLLNETTDGERHMILTQNALADVSYLDYVRFQYGNQAAMLEGGDSQKAFQDYLTDAQKRARHDRDAPDEAKQLRPGESVQIINSDGGGERVQVSGQVAVMAINERLLNALMDKNPELSFALEESFSLPSTYENATVTGPLMELRSADSSDALTAGRAAEVLDYWRTASEDLAAEAVDSPVRKAYAKMATAQSNLFAQRGLEAEAEAGFRLAREMAPNLPEAVAGLAAVLDKSGRSSEAATLLQTLPRKSGSSTGR